VAGTRPATTLPPVAYISTDFIGCADCRPASAAFDEKLLGRIIFPPVRLLPKEEGDGLEGLREWLEDYSLTLMLLMNDFLAFDNHDAVIVLADALARQIITWCIGVVVILGTDGMYACSEIEVEREAALQAFAEVGL